MRIVLITGITSTKPWNTQRQAIIKSGASSLVQSARRRHHVASLYRMDRPRQFLPPSQPTVSTPDACAKSSFGAPVGAEVALGSAPRPRALSDFEVGWGGRIRTYDTQYQKLLPYHLATPQLCSLSYSAPRLGSSPNSSLIDPEGSTIASENL